MERDWSNVIFYWGAVIPGVSAVFFCVMGMAIHGWNAGLGYYNPSVKGTTMHYRSLLVMAIAFIAPILRFKGVTRPAWGYYAGVTTCLTGVAATEVVHHLFVWYSMITRYGSVMWVKDIIIYIGFFTMNIPLYYKLRELNHQGHYKFSKIIFASLIGLFAVLAIVNYAYSFAILPKTTEVVGFITGEEAPDVTLWENIPLYVVEGDVKRHLIRARLSMAVFKIFGFLPFIYWGTGVRKH